MGQIEKIWCLSDREFPEFFKTPPTFISDPFQSRVIAKKTQKSVFLGHPVFPANSLLFDLLLSQYCLSLVAASP